LMKERLLDWECVAAETVGLLRLAAGRNPDDPGIAELVEELSLDDHDFRRMWEDHDVAAMTSGTRRIWHPLVGEMTLSFEALVVPDDTSQVLVIYTAAPGSHDAAALDLLAREVLPVL
jgi:hypothetical protein